MTATFLVAIELEDNADLLGFAEQLTEDLTQDGYDIKSVKPWDRAALALQNYSAVPFGSGEQNGGLGPAPGFSAPGF